MRSFLKSAWGTAFGLVLTLCFTAAVLADSGVVTEGAQNWFGVKTLDPNRTGNVARVGGIVFSSKVASTAVTNTTTETLFDQNYAIPANSLNAGDVLRIRFQGIAPATNSTDTLTIKLYIGGLTGTALITSAAVDVANNNTFQGECDLVVRTAGSSGTFTATSWWQDPGAAGATTPKTAFNASTTLNTTVSQTIGVSATWSVANAGDSCRLDVLNISVN